MNWKKIKLGELIEQYGGLIQTGPFGSQLHEADYSDEGIPVVMPKDIIEGRIDEESAAKVGEGVYRGLKRHKLQVGDIVLPRRGNFDKRAIITEREKGWLCGTGCLKINVNAEVLDAKYFYYYLSLPQVVEYLENLAVGSTMLNLSAGIVERFELPLLPIGLQRQIAAVLGRYDALLENYQAQVAALEAVAQELYREWFVRGRCPGAEARPNGELPAGWAVVELSSISALIQRGITPSYDDEGEILCLNQRCIRDKKIDYSTGRLQMKSPGKKVIRFGDVLINSTGEGTLGRTAQVYDIVEESITVDTHVTIARPLPEIPVEYYGYVVTEQEDYFVSMALGATGQTELSREAIGQAKVILPTTEAMQRFSQLVGPMKKKAIVLQAQITNLSATRDALLPRLLSGQLLPDEWLAEVPTPVAETT